MTTPTTPTPDAFALIGQALEKLNEAALAGCPGMVTAAEPLIKARDLLRVSQGEMKPVDAINGLAWAGSKLNLHQFCEVLGWNEDEYAEAKFRDLQALYRLLGRFDDGTLTKLVEAGRQ